MHGVSVAAGTWRDHVVSVLTRWRASPKSSQARRWPASTRVPHVAHRTPAAPSSSAAYSRSFGANCTPAPPSVSGTAAAAYASTGTSVAIASTQRHAEALVLAQRDVDATPRGSRRPARRRAPGPVKRNRSGGIWYFADQRANRRVVPRHDVVPADEDEPVVRVDVALVLLGQPDVILDPLVRRDPADEQEVREPVVEDAARARDAAARSVSRSVSTAIGITPVAAKPSASSSRRLYSESPSARSTRPASVASSWRPSVGEPEQRRVVRARRTAPA